MLILALNYVKRDHERGDVTESDEQSVLQAMQEILEDLGERRDVVTHAEEVILTWIIRPYTRRDGIFRQAVEPLARLISCRSSSAELANNCR